MLSDQLAGSEHLKKLQEIELAKPADLELVPQRLATIHVPQDDGMI